MLKAVTPLEDFEARKLAYAIAGALAVDDFKEASMMLARSGKIVDKTRRREIMAAANEHFLYPRELEFTSHGIHRSFRFWSVEEKASYLALAADILASLSSLTGHACFGFGTVLGLVRNGALIDHDDDVDLIVSFPRSIASTIPEGLIRVADHLSANGYTVNQRYTGHLKASTRRQKAVDIFVGIEEEEFATWYPGPRRRLVIERLFPAVPKELLGISCLIPHDAHFYLSTVYGEGWRVPDPRFGHSWNRQDVADLLGDTSRAQDASGEV